MGLKKINNRMSWQHCLPTFILKNGIWCFRFGNNGSTYDYEDLNKNFAQFRRPYLDPSVVEFVYCSGHGNECIFKEFLNQLTIQLSRLTNGKQRVTEFQQFCVKYKVSYNSDKFLRSKSKPYNAMVGFRVHENLFGKLIVTNNQIDITPQIRELRSIIIGTTFDNSFLERMHVFGYVNMHTTPIHELIIRKFKEDINRQNRIVNGNVIGGSVIDDLNLYQTADRAYFIIYKYYFFPRFLRLNILGDVNTVISESLGYRLKHILKSKTNHHQDLMKQTSNTRLIKLVINDLVIDYPQVLNISTEQECLINVEEQFNEQFFLDNDNSLQGNFDDFSNQNIDDLNFEGNSLQGNVDDFFDQNIDDLYDEDIDSLSANVDSFSDQNIGDLYDRDIDLYYQSEDDDEFWSL